MATLPGAPTETFAVSPLPEKNQVDAVGSVSRVSVARNILDYHQKALQARRSQMLVWEKMILHVDGTGDLQWADIWNDTRVEIPRHVSEFRKTENLLRLVLKNAVAHHTSMPLRYYAESSVDRVAQEKALIDTLWINHLAYEQNFNGLFAEALTMAKCTGFCPVHAYWRDDVSQDWYEGAGYGGMGSGVAPGMIDCWVGNPFDTVFDRSATRNSVRWMSYARLLPADAVREMFGDVVPEVMGLEGSTRIPSASNFQRVARNWQMAGLGIHGSPILSHRQDDEELMTVICREIAPGVDDHPEGPGRLQLIAVPGTVDLLLGQKAGTAVLLADQPLPGGDFSWTNFHADDRGNDIHGRPWVEDIDQLQVDLNIALSKRWEAVNRMMEAPIIAPGGAIGEDMTDLGGYNLLEIEPSLAGWRPTVMEWPQQTVLALNQEIDDKRRAIYTKSGYQAASRGEAPGSRMAAQAIGMLQEADRSVHGPINVLFRRSATDFARRCWRQFKAYGTVPWLISVTGDQYAHLVDPYIDSTKVSDTPPHYKLVNAFGTSPEAFGQEVIALMKERGADGNPFLRTDEARRIYPNQILFDDAGNPDAVKRRRAKTIAQAFLTEARRYREQTGFDVNDPSDPTVQQVAQQVFYAMEARYPRLRDDDLLAHLSSYSEITQDETADAIARAGLTMRAEMYFLWQEQMANPAPVQQATGVAQ